MEIKSIDHIRCPKHPKEYIRRIEIKNETDVSVLCIECALNNDDKKNLLTLEAFLQKIEYYHLLIPRIKELPDTVNQILNIEDETRTNIKENIEQQKAVINVNFYRLRQSFEQKLEQKRQQIMNFLNDQLATFETNFSTFKDTVYLYKEDSTNQDSSISIPSLTQKINDVKTAQDLQKSLEECLKVTKNWKMYSSLDKKEAEALVYNTINQVGSDLIDLLASKDNNLQFVDQQKFEDMIKKTDILLGAEIERYSTVLQNPVPKLNIANQAITMLKESSILKEPCESSMISEWLFQTLGSKHYLDLVYRGSRDGFSASNFHKRCDNVGPTVTILESTTGGKFGGYCSISWSTEGNYKSAEGSFLFSIDRKQKLPIIRNPQSATYHNSQNGPVFGASHDLYVSKNCSTNNDSFSNLGGSFQKLDGGGYLPGFSSNFTVKEIEVYLVKRTTYLLN